MRPFYIRALAQAQPEAEPGTPIRFVASTEGIKRDGKSLRAGDWRLDNYLTNPVVLWAHDYGGRTLPIGRAVSVTLDGGQMVADLMFDQADDFARQVESKYRRGFLNAVSVGWADVIEGKRTTHDLMDISAVPVPADPQALKLNEARALRQLADELDHAGNGTTHHTRANGVSTVGDYLESRIHYTFTSEADDFLARGVIDRVERIALSGLIGNALDVFATGLDSELPDLRSRPTGYYAQGGEVARGVAAEADVWTWTAGAMRALYINHTAIDDDTRRAIYNSLERVYRRLDKEPPEWMPGEALAALDGPTIAGLFLEGEGAPGGDHGQRAGAVLNARNRDKLAQAQTLIGEVIQSAVKDEVEAEDEAKAKAKVEAEAEDEKRAEASRRVNDLLAQIRQNLTGGHNG